MFYRPKAAGWKRQPEERGLQRTARTKADLNLPLTAQNLSLFINSFVSSALPSFLYLLSLPHEQKRESTDGNERWHRQHRGGFDAS